MTYWEKLKRCVSGGVGLCVGLDPVWERLPEACRRSPEPLLKFCAEIIAATAEHASAYKPNLAFFEAYGAEGWRQLEQVVKLASKDHLVIADAKRGDIGTTSAAYARAVFEGLRADAVTVNPYLGSDSVEPFTADERHGVFVLCVTSNPGGREIQDLKCDGKPIYMHVVRMVRNLNRRRNVGLVVGATRPEQMRDLLGEAGDMPLLIPGVGAQGGDLAAVVGSLRGYRSPVLVNVSRDIIYVSGGEDFAAAAGQRAAEYAAKLKSQSEGKTVRNGKEVCLKGE